MKELLVLFGGQSSEHIVSRNSAASLLPYLDRNVFHVSAVGITQDGKWYLTRATPEEISSGAWERREDNLPAFLSPSRALRGLQVLHNGRLCSMAIDCVFPVMHGQLCEDGAIQGLFELCGIPYVGPNICASACSMDKAVTKLLARESGVRQARYCIVTSDEAAKDAEAAAVRAEAQLGAYPFFIKPASAGSSVGVTKAHNRAELIAAFSTAGAVCNKILVEETIVGREVEVAVLGNRDAKASVVGEVLAANDFYDFDAKYENSASRTVVPADIPPEASEKLRNAAVAVYRALGCEGMSRVDFFLLPDGEIVFNEINTLPGFTKISMYPKLWDATGIPYQQPLTELCNLAMERGCTLAAKDCRKETEQAEPVTFEIEKYEQEKPKYVPVTHPAARLSRFEPIGSVEECRYIY